MNEEDLIYLPEMAQLLGRRPHTLYQWLRNVELRPDSPHNLPAHLMPDREGGRKKIFWRRDQVVPLRSWADESAKRWRGSRAA